MRSVFLLLLFITQLSSAYLYAGVGPSNPTGGFGSSDSRENESFSSGGHSSFGNFQSPNPTGGFGIEDEDFTTLSLLPPTPPSPIPLDSGSIILIFSALLLGGVRIYRDVFETLR